MPVTKESNAASWPNPKGFDPLNIHIEDGFVRAENRFQDYWEKGSSIESRFLDTLINSKPQMIEQPDLDNLCSEDRLDGRCARIKIDENTKQLFLNYASSFRQQAPQEDANRMLAASYMVMLGKLNYSGRRYPLYAEELKGIRMFLVDRILRLYEKRYPDQKIEANKLCVDTLTKNCSEFLKEALETLKWRAEAQFGTGPTNWIHRGIRRVKAQDRLNRLSHDFLDTEAHHASIHPVARIAKVINHLPILVQTVGLTLDGVLKIVTEKNFKAVGDNLKKVWHYGPTIETAAAKELADNPDRIQSFIGRFRDVSAQMPEELAKIHGKDDIKDYDAQTIFLSHLMYLRFKILRNDANIGIKDREMLVDKLENEIIHNIIAPEVTNALSYKKAVYLQRYLEKEGVSDLESISDEQYRSLRKFLHRQQIAQLQGVKGPVLKQLIDAVIDSEYQPLRAVLTPEQRANTHRALDYLRSRLGWELESISKNMLTQHLTISDMMRLMSSPKSFNTLKKSYLTEDDPQIRGIEVSDTAKGLALLQGMILATATPAIALGVAL